MYRNLLNAQKRSSTANRRTAEQHNTRGIPGANARSSGKCCSHVNTRVKTADNCIENIFKNSSQDWKKVLKNIYISLFKKLEATLDNCWPRRNSCIVIINHVVFLNATADIADWYAKKKRSSNQVVPAFKHQTIKMSARVDTYFHAFLISSEYHILTVSPPTTDPGNQRTGGWVGLKAVLTTTTTTTTTTTMT